MRSFLYTLITCISTLTSVYSQNSMDYGVIKEASIHEDSLGSLIDMADSIANTKNYQLAESYYRIAFDLAKKKGVKEEIITSSKSLRKFLRLTIKDYVEEEKVIDFLINYCSDIKDQNGKVQNIISLGNSKEKRFLLIEAFKYYNLAIEEVKKTKNRKLHLDALINRGILLAQIGNMTQSRKDFKKALPYATKEMSTYKYNTYVNIAASFGNKHPDSILYYSRLAALNCKDDRAYQSCYLSYANMAWAYVLKEMPKESLNIINTHIVKGNTEQDKRNLHPSLMHTMGVIHFQFENYEKAISYFKVADRYFIKGNDIKGIIRIKEDLSKAYEKINDLKSSIKILREIKPYTAKLDSLKVIHEIVRDETQKLLNAKEITISNLEKENIKIEQKISKTRIFNYSISIFLVLVITFLLYQGYVSKAKSYKLSEKPNKTNKNEDLIYDFKELYTKIREVPKIAVTDIKGTHVIKLPTVLYCMSNGNYTSFIRENDEEIVVSKNLKYIESKLESFGFFRIHRSYLINLDHVVAFKKNEGGYVVMNDNKSLPITRDSKKGLYERLNVI